jgi:hypothetical protein
MGCIIQLLKMHSSGSSYGSSVPVAAESAVMLSVRSSTVLLLVLVLQSRQLLQQGLGSRLLLS